MFIFLIFSVCPSGHCYFSHLNRCHKCYKNCLEDCNLYSGQCDACKPGFYSRYCNKRCPSNCAQCNRNDRYTCEKCKDRFYCSYQCMCRCPFNCLACNISNAACLSCREGRYGTYCNEQCPASCVNPSSCDKDTGDCLCRPGFFGT